MMQPMVPQNEKDKRPERSVDAKTAAIKRRLQKLKKNDPDREPTPPSSFGGLK